MGYFRFQFERGTERVDPDDHILAITCSAYLWNPHQEEARLAARLAVDVIPTSTEGEALFEVCDADSQLYVELFHALFQDERREVRPDIRPELENELEDWAIDVLIVPWCCVFHPKVDAGVRGMLLFEAVDWWPSGALTVVPEMALSLPQHVWDYLGFSVLPTNGNFRYRGNWKLPPPYRLDYPFGSMPDLDLVEEDEQWVRQQWRKKVGNWKYFTD